MEKPNKIDSFEKADRAIQDIFHNIGLSDLSPSNVRTDVPVSDTLGIGRMALFDNGTARRIYFRALDGTIVSVALT